MTTVTNEEILNEFHRMKDTLDRWRVKVEAKQEKHDKSLYGNGEPGMDERIRNTERDVLEIRKLTSELPPVILFYKVGVWVMGLIGAAIITLIWSLITGSLELIVR